MSFNTHLITILMEKKVGILLAQLNFTDSINSFNFINLIGSLYLYENKLGH